jgi:hypothetical protein
MPLAVLPSAIARSIVFTAKQDAAARYPGLPKLPDMMTSMSDDNGGETSSHALGPMVSISGLGVRCAGTAEKYGGPAALNVRAGLLPPACFSRLNLPTQLLQFFVLRHEFAVGILQRHER